MIPIFIPIGHGGIPRGLGLILLLGLASILFIAWYETDRMSFLLIGIHIIFIPLLVVLGLVLFKNRPIKENVEK